MTIKINVDLTTTMSLEVILLSQIHIANVSLKHTIYSIIPVFLRMNYSNARTLLKQTLLYCF